MIIQVNQLGRDLFGVFTLGLLWSAQPAIVKLSSETDTSPAAFLLSASGGVALLLCLVTLGQGLSLSSLGSQWKFYQASALLGFFFPLLTRLYISDEVPLYLLTVAVALTPGFIAIISSLWLRQKSSPMVIVSLVIGLAGVALAVLPGAQAPGAASLASVLALLLIPLSYALNQVFIYKAYPVGLTAIQVAAGESVHTLLAAMIFVGAVGIFQAGSLQSSIAFTPAVLLWSVITAVEVVAFFWLSSRCRPIAVSVSIYASVGFGVVWGWLFFDETATPLALLGACLVAGSAFGISYHESRRAPVQRGDATSTT